MILSSVAAEDVSLCAHGLLQQNSELWKSLFRLH